MFDHGHIVAYFLCPKMASGYFRARNVYINVYVCFCCFFRISSSLSARAQPIGYFNACVHEFQMFRFLLLINILSFALAVADNVFFFYLFFLFFFISLHFVFLNVSSFVRSSCIPSTRINKHKVASILHILMILYGGYSFWLIHFGILLRKPHNNNMGTAETVNGGQPHGHILIWKRRNVRKQE